MTDAYVYAIKVGGIVRYIGKGSGIPMKRANEHIRTAKRLIKKRESGQRLWASSLYNRLAKAISRGSIVETILFQDGLTHEQAFDLEILEIEAFKAQLWNLDGGGLGGKKISEEHRRKMSEAARRRLQRPGEIERLRALGSRPENIARLRQANPNLGRDPRIKAINAAKAKERWRDPELAARMKRGLDRGREKRWRPKCLDQLEFFADARRTMKI